MDTPKPVRTESNRKVIRSSIRSPGVRSPGRDGLGRGRDAPSRAREARLAWAAEHFPDFGNRIVLHAMGMAEHRPGGELTTESVTAELDRMGAEPLQERPA